MGYRCYAIVRVRFKFFDHYDWHYIIIIMIYIIIIMIYIIIIMIYIIIIMIYIIIIMIYIIIIMIYIIIIIIYIIIIIIYYDNIMPATSADLRPTFASGLYFQTKPSTCGLIPITTTLNFPQLSCSQRRPESAQRRQRGVVCVDTYVYMGSSSSPLSPLMRCSMSACSLSYGARIR